MTTTPTPCCDGHPLTYRRDDPPSPTDSVVFCSACMARKLERFYLDHAADLLDGIGMGPMDPDRHGQSHRLMLSARRLAGQAWGLVARSLVPHRGGGYATDAERAEALELARELARLAWELHGRALSVTDAADTLAAELSELAHRLHQLSARLRPAARPARRCPRAVAPPSRRSLPAHQAAQAPPFGTAGLAVESPRT